MEFPNILITLSKCSKLNIFKHNKNYIFILILSQIHYLKYDKFDSSDLKINITTIVTLQIEISQNLKNAYAVVFHEYRT